MWLASRRKLWKPRLRMSNQLKRYRTTRGYTTRSIWQPTTEMEAKLLDRAIDHLKTKILERSIRLEPTEHVYLLYDTHSPLSKLLAEAYNRIGQSIDMEVQDFYAVPLQHVLQRIGQLKPKDLVVTVQSMAFNFEQYRLRIELFKAGIKNVEHVHLSLIDESQIPNYIDALAFDPTVESPVARRLKAALDNCERVVAKCYGGTELVYEGGMEPALINCGDYTGMENVGGTFPVGEVFTEPKDLAKVNGEAMIFAFPNTSRRLELLEQPVKITIENGVVVDYDKAKAPQSFVDIIEGVKNAEEGLIREFGVGINRYIGKHKLLNDVTAFERMEGLHISLGKKHTVFKKPGIQAKKARLHIDLFLDLDTLIVDDKVVFKDAKMCSLE